MSDFAHLLEPIVINRNLRLRNRMVKAPQSSWFFEEDGSAGDRVVGFYEALARGGVGLSILSAITWRSDHPAGLYGALWDDRFLPGITRIVERSHAHGCPIMCQLHHSGASAMTGHGGGLPSAPPISARMKSPARPRWANRCAGFSWRKSRKTSACTSRRRNALTRRLRRHRGSLRPRLLSGKFRQPGMEPPRRSVRLPEHRKPHPAGGGDHHRTAPPLRPRLSHRRAHQRPGMGSERLSDD